MIDVNRKMMMIGLFLSKFDKEGLAAFGFSGFWEAYNTFALALGGRPKDINNYRDEFDPYFPNPRKGWHQRPLRPSRKEMMAQLEHLTLLEFAELIRKNVSSVGDVEPLLDSKADKKDGNVSFARRMMTGQSAENYFENHFQEIHQFNAMTLTRTTAYGCGFDFKLDANDSNFYAVEVKGLSAANGAFQMTDKEHRVADYLKDRYYLFLLRGFATPCPFYTLICNPLASGLDFNEQKVVTQQTVWSSKISKDSSWR